VFWRPIAHALSGWRNELFSIARKSFILPPPKEWVNYIQNV